MNIKFYLVNISRLLASYLSLPFVFMNKPLKKNKEIKILSDLLQYTKTNNFKNNNVSKTKTHRDFGNKLFNLIKKKKKINFFNLLFIF